MPIAYNCPHCGKHHSVADQYAGQTGPCSACGKPITIPFAAPGPGQAYAPPPSSGAGTAIGVVVVVALLVGILPCTGILIALLLPAVQAAREAARRSQSQNNLKQIALALHNYHDTYGTFPPAVVKDGNGTPLYSGRVLLLPFMEQKPLYDQFDLSQPWNSPQNKALSETVLPVFKDPSSAGGPPAQTDYLFVSGPRTIFEGDKPTRIADILDGTSNTMMIIEIQNSGINWAEPRDIDLSGAGSLPPGNHPNVNLAAMADGSVRAISQNINPSVMQSLITKDGGEAVSGY